MGSVGCPSPRLGAGDGFACQPGQSDMRLCTTPVRELVVALWVEAFGALESVSASMTHSPSPMLDATGDASTQDRLVRFFLQQTLGPDLIGGMFGYLFAWL